MGPASLGMTKTPTLIFVMKIEQRQAAIRK